MRSPHGPVEPRPRRALVYDDDAGWVDIIRTVHLEFADGRTETITGASDLTALAILKSHYSVRECLVDADDDSVGWARLRDGRSLTWRD